MELEVIDTQTQHWPSYEEPRVCHLIRFTYQLGAAAYTNIGIVGPLTYAFDVDLQDLPPGDIYALFAGWWLSKDTSIYEMGVGDGAIFKMWLLLVRIVAPLAVAAIFVFNLA